MKALLSHDLPRSGPLSVLLLIVLFGLLLGPFLFDSPRAFATMGTICIFIIVVASYDLMLGYTHTVSFAHTMFFGLGAYGVAIASQQMGPGLAAIAAGAGVALLISTVLSLLLAVLSLRVRTLFFSLVTLAVAFAFMSLVTQWYGLTGGEDGLRIRLPAVLGPAHRLLDHPLPGLDLPGLLRALPNGLAQALQQASFDFLLSGRHLVYYLCLATALLVFLLLLRVVNSPFGQVLQAIRENETRARALGYSTVVYRSAAVCLAGALATVAGVLFALFNRFVDAANTLDFELMVFILIMCVMGGMGTLYGAVLGVTLFILAQNYLQDLLRVLSEQWLSPDNLLAPLFAPEHWLLWFGLLFVVSVYVFPDGIVGRLRRLSASRAKPAITARSS